MDIHWLEVIVTSAITTPAVSGLLGFLGKRILAKESAKQAAALETLRAKYERELEGYKSELNKSHQLLQAEIDKTILVTKVHFETEFNALKRIQERLAEIRLQFPGLRPLGGRPVPAGDTIDAKRKRLLKSLNDFMNAHDLLVTTHENLKPFYPEEIYLRIEQCRTVAAREILQIRTAGDVTFKTEWFLQGDRNLGDFLEAYNAVVELIRERISKLAVIPST